MDGDNKARFCYTLTFERYTSELNVAQLCNTNETPRDKWEIG